MSRNKLVVELIFGVLGTILLITFVYIAFAVLNDNIKGVCMIALTVTFVIRVILNIFKLRKNKKQ